MATVIPQATHNSSPGMTYYMDAEQTGGSGTQRTIKITLYLKCGGSSSASWYGYPVNWKGRIHNSYSGFMTVKGTESWNGSQGFRSFTWTATVDVGTTASTNITVGFETDSYNGSSNWDLVKTGTFTVGKTNTAPYFTSGEQWLRIRPGSDSGTVFNGYYPENTSYLYIDWGYASDDEGGTIDYSLNQSVNGGGWSQVDWGTDRAHGVQIGSGNEGQRLQYYVDARDNGGLWSNKVYSATITKNTLNGGSFSGHSNDINYHSTSVTLHIKAGSNTDGSVVKYMCYSDNVTVYNQQDTTSPSQTITIWKSGNLPSGPYIKFDDLKNYFAGSNYNGRLHVGLKTSNNYGTSKWSSGSIGVDLRINPQGARNQAISTDSNLSPMYKKVASTGNYYFLPNGSDTVRIHWNNGWGLLGESIRYELYVAYGSGSWQKIADMANVGEYIGYDHVIGTQTSRVQFKYLIRTITSYGYYTDVTTSAKNLDYYNQPKLTVSTINRTSYTAEVKLTVSSNSSIPNINTIGNWECQNTGEMSVLYENPNGDLSPSQTEQTISIERLFGEYQHRLIVNFKDDTGFSSFKRQEIQIPANKPAFFVNKYGIGVNGAKADSETVINASGQARASGFNAYGYGSQSTGNLGVKWIKLVTLKVYHQFSDSSTTFNALDWGSGNANPCTFKMTVRVKQQNAMGGAPSCSCYISDNINVVKEDFRLITTVNTTGLTECQLWMQVRQSYTAISVAPVQSIGYVEYRDGMELNDAPPSGSSIIASYLDFFTHTLYTTRNSDGFNVKLGDDCWIGDIDTANSFCVKGAQDNKVGWIYFGNGGGKIGYNGNGGSSIDLYPGNTNGAINQVNVGGALIVQGSAVFNETANFQYGKRSIQSYGDGTYSISINSHSNGTWFRNNPGRWVFQRGAGGDNWTESMEWYLESADKGSNGSWLCIGQRQSNESHGRYRGVQIVNYTSGQVILGDVRAKYYDIGNVHGTNGLSYGSGDGADWNTCNMDLHSWWGVGIKGLAGNVFGDGSRTVLFNSRQGHVIAKGTVSSNQYYMATSEDATGFVSRSVKVDPINSLDKLNELQVKVIDNIVPFSLSEDYEDVIPDEPVSKIRISGIKDTIPEIISNEIIDEETNTTEEYVDIYGLLAVTIKALQEASTKISKLEEKIGIA